MAVLMQNPNGQLLVAQSVLGPASYSAAARPTIVFSDLRQGVDLVLGIFTNAGRVADQVTMPVGSRTLTFRVRGQPAALASGAGLPEVPDTTNLSAETYVAYAIGT